MRIPERFQLLGQSYTVTFDPDLVVRTNHVGEMYPKEGRILLQCATPLHPQSRAWLEQTFLHEIVHAILATMNEEDLEKNEKFVDVFAALLHHVLDSGEGDLQ